MMFWKREKPQVPIDWKEGDKIEEIGFTLLIYIGYLVSISPCRTIFILNYYGDLKEYNYKKGSYHNKSLENRTLQGKIVDWESYNKALKELQEKFGI